MKTDIFNLIILDESGSMDCVANQTISGCNETINTIRSAQEKYADTQNHYVSIYAFQSRGNKPSRYLIKNCPIDKVENINRELYQPWGCTPLYDAVGSTLVDLKSIVKEKELAIGSVTIITDGLENSSRHYSREKVAMMIDDLEELGWNFNFIGANIDVENTARSLNISNSLAFSQDDEGMKKMIEEENRSRDEYYDRICGFMQEESDSEDGDDEDEEGSKKIDGETKKKLLKRLKEAGKNYFKDPTQE